MLNSNYNDYNSKFAPDKYGCIERPLTIVSNDNYTITIKLDEIENEFPNSLKLLKIVEEKFYAEISEKSNVIHDQDEIILQVSPGVKYWFRIYAPVYIGVKNIYVYQTYYECILTKNNIKLLYTKSCELFAEIKKKDTQIDQLYRCKPKSYFDKIEELNNGIMCPYPKDNTGHSGNPITGKVRGLFFSGKYYNGNEFPRNNPYGDTRFVIEAHKLLNPNIHNYYFSDMYCAKSDNTHILTIVVCKKDTPEDDFCKKHLVHLPSKDNEFMYCIQEDNTYTYYWNWCVKNKIFLNFEVFYCGEVSIYDGEMMRVSCVTGRGKTTPGGIGHNEKCKICNI
uniref:PHYHIP_C domain-containing protein n=1 Tax=Strongyloides venezuelensis TaxID=75913 RepID=A0A0K0G476_STRVS